MLTNVVQNVQSLAIRNAHPRDAFVRFEEGPHKYYIKGATDGWISVTTIIHSLFPEFNTDDVITNMFAGYNWKKSPWFGKTREEIKNEWATSNKEASDAGTKMHLNIEQFYNGLEHETDSKEWKMFEQYKIERPY